MPEVQPEEVWEIGPLDDPGLALGQEISTEDFYPLIKIIEIYEPGQTTPNSIGNYLA